MTKPIAELTEAECELALAERFAWARSDHRIDNIPGYVPSVSTDDLLRELEYPPKVALMRTLLMRVEAE